MNRIRFHARRFAGLLAGLAGTLLALSAGAPAAFAMTPPPISEGGGAGSPVPARVHTWVGPPSGPLSRFQPGPVQLSRPPHHTSVPAHVHAAMTGGMPGWQITLIAIGAALAAAMVAVILDRVRAARHRLTTSAA
jgi:hypothetical protein